MTLPDTPRLVKRFKRIYHKPFMDKSGKACPPDTREAQVAGGAATETLAQAAERLEVDLYALDERAAIMEYEGGMSASEAERMAISEAECGRKCRRQILPENR